ncbi:MAG TPA: hypothetical protein ENN65_07845 [Candidatus Hydrogenedentes bacterium]|nr:hypothetical protein [Candidatus Hydrogenedentota bacterium]
MEMMRIVGMISLLCILFSGGASAAEASFEQQAEEALRRALTAMATRQTHGGWGRAYTLDGSIMWGEHRPIPKHAITIQPPATPTVAGVYLRAAQVLGDDAFAANARAARNALLAMQTPEGGFPHEGNPAGPTPKMGTFDDDTTTGALNFLIDWWQYTGKAEDWKAVERVGEFLLLSQYSDSGGWPQAYPPPSGGYAKCITFNDNAMTNVIKALLRLHAITGGERYLAAAKKGGDCIIRLQGGPGEEIWAQQYDPETLAPAWARNFEPPGYSTAESIGVCNILIDLYLATGEDRYLEPLPKAFGWYEACRLPNGKWARLYEPGTQRPVYGRRDKPEPVYEFENACSGYGWQGNWYPHDAKRAYDRIREIGRTAYLQERNTPKQKGDPKALEERVRAVCQALGDNGWWVSAPTEGELEEYRKASVPEDMPMVHMNVFNRNAHSLMDYLEAMRE